MSLPPLALGKALLSRIHYNGVKYRSVSVSGTGGLEDPVRLSTSEAVPHEWVSFGDLTRQNGYPIENEIEASSLGYDRRFLV